MTLRWAVRSSVVVGQKPPPRVAGRVWVPSRSTLPAHASAVGAAPEPLSAHAPAVGAGRQPADSPCRSAAGSGTA